MAGASGGRAAGTGISIVAMVIRFSPRVMGVRAAVSAVAAAGDDGHGMTGDEKISPRGLRWFRGSTE
ncbi:hypothetical protein GCM10025881_35730 [Pseudolysinimonas kribbensis]|uniref:Uncharacterized protein n=1 Tax=Pseudolysinimonas kribbensis TaxID=433641 RepID=A0ABQ6K8K3_9MICO|nr:hypothetical protein GCM10025881_35730 [Pseudolysinimonas kribbensis]